MRPKRSNINRTGFTLVELSIVIIIIGFLIAGVSSGISLIKQAKLNAIVSERTTFNSAINAFQVRYNGLPGDMTNASAYWPNCGPTPTNCNGNGDGRIFFNWTELTNESYRAWQHLTLAGIIAGSYTGVGESSSIQAIPGINVPVSKYDSSSGYYFDNAAGDPNIAMALGKERTDDLAESSGVLLPPNDVYHIDLKIDDGLASTGMVRGSPGILVGVGWDPDCTSADVYLHLDQNTPHCRIINIIEDK